MIVSSSGSAIVAAVSFMLTLTGNAHFAPIFIIDDSMCSHTSKTVLPS